MVSIRNPDYTPFTDAAGKPLPFHGGTFETPDGVTTSRHVTLGVCQSKAGHVYILMLQPYTVLEEARVGERCILGPFSRLRPGTDLAEEVHLGNFVETKKARLGRGSKANHLAYLGDASVGAKANVVYSGKDVRFLFPSGTFTLRAIAMR